MTVNSRVQKSTAPKTLVLDSLFTSMIPTICSCTSTHRSRTSAPLTRAIVNALHLAADMEPLVPMTTTTVLVDHLLVVTVRVATIVSDLLVDDRMTTMVEENMDDAHHREGTHMEDRRLLDENHMATTLTTEARRHHREATAPIHTSEMVTHTLVGQGLHQEESMGADMQTMAGEDTGESPASTHDSTLLASVGSHFPSAYLHRSCTSWRHHRRTELSDYRPVW
jgi:hypothetical protein